MLKLTNLEHDTLAFRLLIMIYYNCDVLEKITLGNILNVYEFILFSEVCIFDYMNKVANFIHIGVSVL